MGGAIARNRHVEGLEHTRAIQSSYQSTRRSCVTSTKARTSNLRPSMSIGRWTYRCTSHAGGALGFNTLTSCLVPLASGNRLSRLVRLSDDAARASSSRSRRRRQSPPRACVISMPRPPAPVVGLHIQASAGAAAVGSDGVRGLVRLPRDEVERGSGIESCAPERRSARAKTSPSAL